MKDIYDYKLLTPKSFQAFNVADEAQRLTTLRSQLLALSRTEGQLNELRNCMTDSTLDTELSIIEVLEFWQQIFRDTFQQYHRLSTRLVRNEDRAAALNMWHDYLLHVQLFLSESLPENYVCLNEYRNLCEIHQNVLTSQQAILSVKTDRNVIPDSSLLEKFNKLSTLHNETLSRIIARHTDIEQRLKLWNKYKNDHTNLLNWLKEKEREKSRLQLRYIHLQRIPHILNTIQNMLSEMEKAQNDCADLRSQQAEIIRFCNDSALITSMRMELGAIGQRIENLGASLETWNDFLCRISRLSSTYNCKVKELQSQFKQVQDIILETSKPIPQGRDRREGMLTDLRRHRVSINNLISELESVTIIQEELKECLYPSNIKTIRRTTHTLWQQQADLDYQLSYLITNTEDLLKVTETFATKYDRFMKWLIETEQRLESESSCVLYDSEELLRSFERDLQSEFVLREREKEWLLATGRDLLCSLTTSNENESEKFQRIEMKKKLDMLVDRWENLKILCKSRVNKVQELKMTLTRIEDRIATARLWLHNVEVALHKPITFESSANSALNKTIQENEMLQRSIEKESGSIGEVLNLCEMIMSDVEMWRAHANMNSLSTAIETLDRRWKFVCNSSVERKQRIHTIWSLLQDTLEQTNDLNSWVNEQENALNELEDGVEKLTKFQTEQRINDLECKIREIEHCQPRINSLALTYSKLVKCNGINPANIQDLANPCKLLMNRYDKLIPRALDIIGKLNMDMKVHQQFVNLYGKSIIALSQIDAELTKAEHLTKGDAKQKFQTLNVLEHELKLCENNLASADELGLEVMKRSDRNEVDVIQNMIDEYQSLWKDITTRIKVIKTKIITHVNQEKEEKLVYRSECDTAVQVNTLPSLNRTTSIAPKDVYIQELKEAIKECHENLDELEKEINNPQRKPASQVVQKLCSNCQSSVELIHHLSNLLITEYFCSDEDAYAAEVANMSSRYDSLTIIWKSKERQLENR